MNNPTLTAPAETAEEQAAQIINGVVDRRVEEGNMTTEKLARDVELHMQLVSGAVRSQLQRYINGVKKATEGAQVEELDEDVGGQVDSSGITIATETLKVQEDIETTLAQADETKKHEDYHLENRHLEALKTAGGDGAELELANQRFNREQLIEGLTVEQTGDRFVSDEYREFRNRLMGAMSAADLDIEDVEEAVNEEKDLTLIDDRRGAGSNRETPEAIRG